MDKIESFAEFSSSILNSSNFPWKSNWNSFIDTNLIAFYRLTTQPNLRISFHLEISHDLTLKIFKKENKAAKSESAWLLDDDARLESWLQLHELLNFYSNEPEICVESNEKEILEKVMKILEEIQSSAEIEREIEEVRKKIREILGKIEEKFEKILTVEENFEICENCGKTYKNLAALKQHVNDCHSTLR